MLENLLNKERLVKFFIERDWVVKMDIKELYDFRVTIELNEKYYKTKILKISFMGKNVYHWNNTYKKQGLKYLSVVEFQFSINSILLVGSESVKKKF